MAPLRPLQPALRRRLRPPVRPPPPRPLTLLLVILLALLAAPAEADVYDDNPATASRGPGDAWIFARGPGGDVLERHRTTGGWSEWASIGGVATSGPAAAPFGDSLFVFVRGTDGQLFSNTFANGSWSGWKPLGGYLTSAPAAALRRGNGYLDVAVRANDNSIAFRSYNAAIGWSPWDGRGGAGTSAPAVASYQDGRLNVWVRGTDSGVYAQDWNGSAWSEWGGFGGLIFGAPAVVSRAPGIENLYVRGGGNVTYIRSWSAGAQWSGFALLDPRPIDSAPAAAGDGPNHEWIVARSGNNLLYKEWTAGGGWLPWQDFGPVAVPAPPVVAPVSTPVGDVNLEAGAGCTPVGGRVRVRISLQQVKGKMVRVTFFTKGKDRTVRIDRHAPFDVRIKVNRPAGSRGRVYARLYYRPTAKRELRHKTISGSYRVCR